MGRVASTCRVPYLRDSYCPTLLTEPQRTFARWRSNSGNSFNAHKHRYSGYRTHADVGIVYHDLPKKLVLLYEEFHSFMDLAKALAGRGVLWDVLTENRCNKKNFSRLRVLIYQDVSRISEAEAEAVLEFIGPRRAGHCSGNGRG